MKLKSTIVLVLLLLSFPQIRAQVAKVKYTSILNDIKDYYGDYRAANGTLWTNENRSYYTETPYDTVLEIHSQELVDFAEQKWELKYYKNLKAQEFIYKDITAHKKLIIEDCTYPINWHIKSDTKKILGYTCQAATGTLRGRTYTAYFAPKIPLKNGPFKFDGLPGLILEVTSDDGAVHIIAKGIEFNVDEPIKNPYKDTKKTVSWEEYQDIYQKWFHRMTNYYNSQKDMTVYFPKRFIEVVIPD